MLNAPASSAITSDDVIWCYRQLLGREPESDAAIQSHLKMATLRNLVQVFVSSAEYQTQRGVGNAQPVQFFHPQVVPKTRIDIDLSPADMGRAIAKVKAAWSQLGLRAPHHSVLTDEQFLPQNLNASINEFWKSGERPAEVVVGTLDFFGIRSADKVIVEYGCGVGRVTWALAQRFNHVHGYDISPHHLAAARDRVNELGLRNVSLHECGDSFLRELEQCDVFYSDIVFQHNPPPIINALIGTALGALRPGGVAIFQVPTYRVGYRFDASEWLADPTLRMEMHCIPQRRVFQAMREHDCVPLSVREDGYTGDKRYISNTFVLQKSVG
jgi:SAM-dependent methyltransferase